MTVALPFLDGGGEAARMIRERDWSRHPMGAPERWPDSFKAALSLALNSPESMILAWGPGLHFFFNEAYFPLLGPRLTWAMGERFDRVWADGWEQAKPIIDEAMAGRARRFVDLPWKLGTDRGAQDTWWTFSYSRVLDAAGAAAGLFILTNETTDRVLADLKVKTAEDQLLRAQQAGGVGLFTIDVATDDVIATPEFCRIYGVPVRERFPLGEVQALVVSDDAGAMSTRADREAGRMAPDAEFRIRRPDTGAVRWIARRADAGHDAEGRVTQYAGAVRDVTEQRWQALELAALNRNLEEQVRQRTADRDALWQLSRDLMLRCTFEGVITAVNPAWTELLGWTKDELLGTDLFHLIHPDDRTHTAEGARDLAEGRGHVRFDNRYRHRDGSYRWISWSTRSSERFIAATGRDVTAEVEQAQALAKVEEQLRQSQKMEAVGQLTGGLAHDFNNLLTGITGALDLIERRIGQGRYGDVERFAAIAQGSARRAAALTHRLLAFSRRQTLDPKPTDANALVSGIEDMIRRTVGPAVHVEAVKAAGLWSTLVDPNQLENAVLNLCINARDALPEGGRLTIETANRWIDQRTARERDLLPGQYVSVCVSDTGTGMTPDVVAKAFDPFFTTKPIGQGTGLGLSMIYGFARQSGGQARIYSEPGEGTMVCLYLPRHLGPAETAETVPELDAATPAATGETVLVVDDEPSVRLLVLEILSELGYAAVEAADGPSGLRVLQSDARIDLLITDVGLPGGMNGRQVADAVRVLRPTLKVLFITGFAENALIGNGQLEPGMHVMTKPFAVEALASRVRELISTSGPATPTRHRT